MAIILSVLYSDGRCLTTPPFIIYSMTMVMVTFLSGGTDMVSESDLGTAAQPVVIAITSAINSIFMGISSVGSSKL